MRRCDSAAIVPNTSELLPEPETPVNTVSRRFGISTLMSFKLLTRAPCTRIKSWLSAIWVGGVRLSVVVTLPVAVLIASVSSVERSRLSGTEVRVASLDLTSFAHYVRSSLVLHQSEDVAVGVGE